MRNRGCGHPKMLHLSCSCSRVGFLPQEPALHERLQGGSFPGVTCASRPVPVWAPLHGLSVGCSLLQSLHCCGTGSPLAAEWMRVDVCSTMAPHGLREGSLLSSALLHRLQGISALTPRPPPPPLSSSWCLQSCSSLFPLTLLSQLPHRFFYPFL